MEASPQGATKVKATRSDNERQGRATAEMTRRVKGEGEGSKAKGDSEERE